MPNKIVAALLFFSAVTLCAAPVNLLFFHSECRECEIVQIYLQELSANFEEVSIHDYPLEDEANFSHLLKLESALNLENSKNAPVSVFLYTNAFYGLTEITNALPVRVMASLKTGAAIFDPNLDNSAEDLAKKRLARFTLTSVLINGLLDGINPCAFATLILFISLLSVYGSSRKEMLATGLVFTLAIFLTYLGLGLGLFNAIKALGFFPKIKLVFDYFLSAFCFVCAILSIKDAIHVKKHGLDQNEGEKLSLSLPTRLRNYITKIISNFAGRGRWLLGVALAGFLVSLLESVCTGQVYIPTINLIIKKNPARAEAWLWLFFYNFLFVLPLFILTFLAAYGLKSKAMLKIQRRAAFPIRILMALLFLVMGFLLLKL